MSETMSRRRVCSLLGLSALVIPLTAVTLSSAKAQTPGTERREDRRDNRRQRRDDRRGNRDERRDERQDRRSERQGQRQEGRDNR